MKMTTKKQITMTRKEAEVLMFGMDFAVGEIGEPECPKCRKALHSIVKKLDKAFEFLDGEADDFQECCDD
jgi:hypothetical protein